VKFSFSANAFRKFSLVETIRHLADAGYGAIEIMADTPHAYPPHLDSSSLREIKETLKRYSMKVANINAFMMHAEGDTWHPSWIEKDENLRRKRIEHTINCIDLAAEIGADTISTEPGGPLAGMTQREGELLFREGLLEVSERARDQGVRILIEPEPGLLIETSHQFSDFFHDLDPDVFGLNFDIGHFFCVGEDPADLVEKLKAQTRHYHLEDIAADRGHHHLMPGQGAIDLRAVLSAIKATDYTGYITVELYPYENEPVATAREALAYLQKITGSFAD